MSKPRTSKRPLSNRSLAALAMLQSGYDDLNLIGHAVGISVDEVKAIDSAEDQRIRHVIREGLPKDFVYRLRHAVKCRICGGRITLVPCVMCR